MWEELELICQGLFGIAIISSAGLLVMAIIMGIVFLMHHGLGWIGLTIITLSASWVLGHIIEDGNG